MRRPARSSRPGGRVLAEPFDIPVGRVTIVADPFGNALVLLDLSKGRYVTDDTGQVTGLTGAPPAADGSTAPTPRRAAGPDAASQAGE